MNKGAGKKERVKKTMKAKNHIKIQTPAKCCMLIVPLIPWLHLALWVHQMTQILCCDWLPKQVRWAVLPTWVFFTCCCLVKTARQWSLNFFSSKYVYESLLCLNTHEKNIANILPSSNFVNKPTMCNTCQGFFFCGQLSQSWSITEGKITSHHLQAPSSS